MQENIFIVIQNNLTDTDISDELISMIADMGFENSPMFDDYFNIECVLDITNDMIKALSLIISLRKKYSIDKMSFFIETDDNLFKIDDYFAE